jgi:hypothetical protein
LSADYFNRFFYIFALDSEFLGHILLRGRFETSVNVSRLRVECVAQGIITISAEGIANDLILLLASS